MRRVGTWVVLALIWIPPLAPAVPAVPAVLAVSAVLPEVPAAHAVAPVPGEVIRVFDPPAGPYGPGHRGVDLRAVPGERVRAALDGVVTFAGQVGGHGWVTVAHGGGLDTTYGWLEPRNVRAGDRVQGGEVLGRLAGDAAHLDWGARLEGAYIDPLLLLGRWEAHLVSVGA